jgi:hypothetical protein
MARSTLDTLGKEHWGHAGGHALQGVGNAGAGSGRDHN